MGGLPQSIDGRITTKKKSAILEALFNISASIIPFISEFWFTYPLPFDVLLF
jgi:hypothetical protein